MTTVHHLENDPTVLAGLEVGDRQYLAFTKGSVDGLLDVSSHIWVEGKAQTLDDSWRARMEAAKDRLARGMRVLGVRFRLMDYHPRSSELTLNRI